MLEQRMHTRMIPGTSTKTREAEVQSLYSLEVCGMHEIELAYQKSQVERDNMGRVRVRYSECGNIHDMGNLNTQ